MFYKKATDNAETKPALHYTICNYVIFNEMLDNLTIGIKTE